MKVVVPSTVFNKKFLPLLGDDRHRYLVLYGGAGSGKSVFAAQRLLVRMMGSFLCNLLVVRAVASTNRDSTYALFKQIISQWGVESLFRCRDSLMSISCINGNTAIFKGLDDSEKLKSVTFPKGELTDIWVEEASEISEADFNQLDVRLRGGSAHKQITLTFNPVSALHWLKKRFFDTRDDRAVVLKTTYRDNAHIDREYKQTLEGYRETDPYFYSVYCLGEWGVLGQTVFDSQKAAERLAQVKQPLETGKFAFETYFDRFVNEVLIRDGSIGFKEEARGWISVYKRPEKGRFYVIGGDTAGEGSDYFVGQVIDSSTGEQVCTLRGKMDEDIYAKQMYCLGIWYNTALLSVEANFSSYPIRTLERLRYPKQFVRQAEDSFTHKLSKSYGFRTTAVTRPLIISGLTEIVREHTEWINDRTTLEEMLTFVRNEKGRAEAQAGAHDDCVMALAIAYYSREQQEEKRGGREGWTEDMWEDYQRASPEDKAMLRKRWGDRC